MNRASNGLRQIESVTRVAQDSLGLCWVFRSLSAALFSVLFFSSSAPAQDPQTRVSGYSIHVIDADGQSNKLDSPKQSLLNWSNPVFGTTSGGLYLWTDSVDRPAAVMKTYKTRNGRWFEQIRSFSRYPMTARDSKGEVFWSPERGSEPMKPLPNAPTAVENSARRLAQIKTQHRRFEVTGEIQGAGGWQDLRPYPTPLYRYGRRSDSNDPVPEGDIIDGVLLGFMQGTGPDVLLMIEIRQVGGVPQWYYCVGSIGIFAIDVKLDGKSVWSEARRTAQNTRPTDLYDGRRLVETELQ